MTDTTVPPLDRLPGYRRRFVITPEPGRVRADLEDDYHCMTVTVHHADGIATSIEPSMHRWPWTTCPGAEAVLVTTFGAVPLDRFAQHGDKASNCTHLYDLATLAAAHALDDSPLVYDVLFSDPACGRSRAELRRNGETMLAWTIEDGVIVEPAAFAGTFLMKLKPVLEQLDAAGQEAAKILRWGILVGGGRSIPLSEQSDATKVPPNCFTFQPAMAAKAVRFGAIRDFSTGRERPLDGAKTESI